MRANLAYKKQCKLAAALADVFSQAAIYHLPHHRIVENLKERVWQPKKKLPQWAQHYLAGYEDALWPAFYREHLEWRVKLDGQYIGGEDVPHNRWSEVESGAGAFFYKGTDRQFSDLGVGQ